MFVCRCFWLPQVYALHSIFGIRMQSVGKFFIYKISYLRFTIFKKFPKKHLKALTRIQQRYPTDSV